MEHPCIGCSNNWSGDPVPCVNFCPDFETWKRANEDTDKLTSHQLLAK
jgi:Ni,Fe-hydrogenase I small subunit